ncbi:unnamed protein product [Orchesella dallaii]|uniref:Uncharacterized protein n=1 Tax=Orchesella dallaii TaxID=48710 RepID=A0ABP1QS98_9HEXA
MRVHSLETIFIILVGILSMGQEGVANNEAIALDQKLSQQLGALEGILIGLFALKDAGELDTNMRRNMIRNIQRIAQYIGLMADTLEELIKFPEEEQGLGPDQGASGSLDGIGDQGKKSWLSWLIDVVG